MKGREKLEKRGASQIESDQSAEGSLKIIPIVARLFGTGKNNFPTLTSRQAACWRTAGIGRPGTIPLSAEYKLTNPCKGEGTYWGDWVIEV